MDKRVLVVVDMQNYFITGEDGCFDARKIVPKVVRKINNKRAAGYDIIYLYDVSDGTLEPYTSDGYRLDSRIEETMRGGDSVIVKTEQRSLDLLAAVMKHDFQYIELVGLLTDQCVAENALMIKRDQPHRRVAVDIDCCAGSDGRSTSEAVWTMADAGIEIRGAGKTPCRRIQNTKEKRAAAY